MQISYKVDNYTTDYCLRQYIAT